METECPSCDDLLRERDDLVARLAAVRALCERNFNMEDHYEIDANDVAAILEGRAVLAAVDDPPAASCCERRPCGGELLHQDDCPVYLAILADPDCQPVAVVDGPAEVDDCAETWGVVARLPRSKYHVVFDRSEGRYDVYTDTTHHGWGSPPEQCRCGEGNPHPWGSSNCIAAVASRAAVDGPAQCSGCGESHHPNVIGVSCLPQRAAVDPPADHIALLDRP